MGGLFGGGGSGSGGSSSMPKPPPFKKINISDLAERWISKDIETYDFNDQQWAGQFPGLSSGRNTMIDQMYAAINGPLDPTLESKFVKDALGRTTASLGGGQADASASLQKGALGYGATSADVARSTSAYRDIMGTELDQLLAANPSRLVGPGMSDITNLNLYNQAGGQNAANAGYQSAISMANANFASQQAQYAALASTIGGATKAYSSYNTGGYGGYGY